MRPLSTYELQRLQQQHAAALLWVKIAIGSMTAPQITCRVQGAGDEPILLSSGMTPGVVFHFAIGTAYEDGQHVWITERDGQPIPPEEYIPTAQLDRAELELRLACRKRQLS